MRRIAPAMLALVALSLGAWRPALSEAPGLYDARIPVSGEGSAERERALRAALLEVAVRVSGQRRVPPTGVLSAALQDPNRYVAEYAYTGDEGGGGRGKALRVRLEPAATGRLLREAGVPVWDGPRPTVAIWLAVEESGDRRLVGAGDASALPGVVEARALARGISLVLPTLDAQERGRIADVWGDSPDRLLALSRRYGADVVLLGKARERIPGLWETRWTLAVGGELERYGADGEMLDRVVAEGLDRAVDGLASRYAAAPAGPAGPLPELVVAGIGGFDDYVRARRHLESSGAVTSVRTVRFEPGRVIFSVTSGAGMDEVSRSLAAAQKLIPSEGGGEWLFRLAP